MIRERRTTGRPGKPKPPSTPNDDKESASFLNNAWKGVVYGAAAKYAYNQIVNAAEYVL